GFERDPRAVPRRHQGTLGSGLGAPVQPRGGAQPEHRLVHRAPGRPVTSWTCRSCGSAELHPVLSLGETPLANSLLSEEQLGEPEPRYPLDLVLCRACALVQITETVPPEVLFRDYLYFSSFSDTMLRHAQAIVERVLEWQSLEANSTAVEI